MISVCVLFGGISSEHEVSLRSAASVIRNIKKDKYIPHMLGITKEGQWLYYSGDVQAIESGQWLQNKEFLQPAIISPDRTKPGILLIDKNDIIPLDVAFPVLHGKNGEDGTIQGLFELAGIPCVGCGVLSSAVCMDKEIAHRLLIEAGIPKTKLICITKKDMADISSLTYRSEKELGYPIFVKPANTGSSIGVAKAENTTRLITAIEEAFAWDHKVILEQAVPGREIECAVMGNENPIAADVLAEIVSAPGSFYDYNAKYINDSAKLVIPAHMEPEKAVEIRKLALDVYRALDCRGFARVDFFLRPDGKVILNEVNTIPGFTSISMFPKMFIESGVPYSEIVERLIRYAME